MSFVNNINSNVCGWYYHYFQQWVVQKPDTCINQHRFLIAFAKTHQFLSTREISGGMSGIWTNISHWKHTYIKLYYHYLEVYLFWVISNERFHLIHFLLHILIISILCTLLSSKVLGIRRGCFRLLADFDCRG